MSAPDTSAEAVERVAQLLDEVAEPLRWDCATRNEAAALLRALVAERDRMDKALMREAEGERAAYARGFREGAAAAATLVATHAYAVNNAGPYLKPSEFAEIDVHHKTIAAAIRALPLPEPQA